MGLRVACCAACCLVSSAQGLGVEPVEADVVLRGGTLIDGTGEPRRVGAIALRGDRIVAVGQFDIAGSPKLLDCTGLVVAPGFIDIHDHSDKRILEAETRGVVNALLQGCTTVVTGNCGAGPIDVGEYYSAIEQDGAGTNVAHLLGHGSLRETVIGNVNRAATAEEINQMRRIAEHAMQDGAWGMSTGLIYVPGSYANTDELVAIAEVIGTYGGFYASHMRDESSELLASIDELLEIGHRANLPVHVSHFKASGEENWGLIRQATRVIQQARDQGQAVTADQYPYTASSTSLAATLLPAATRSGGREELIKRLDHPEIGSRIREHVADSLRRKQEGAAIRIARYSTRPDWIGRNLAEIAAVEKLTPTDLCLHIFREGEAQIVNFCMSEEDVRFAMQIPWVATASDGRTAIPGPDRPHPRYYGTFPRKIGYYSLREKVLPIEQAIRSASGLPADILGMSDRGYLKPGQFADVVVFDPQRFIDVATYDDPHQYAEGVVALFVNGQLAVSQGKPTKTLAGRALRHTPRKAGE
ncbi:MAG: D-aminoacylase [Planctomycetaceae bacterium]|nr:D-aminoacylase [Planctomycetaceae bacterium]